MSLAQIVRAQDMFDGLTPEQARELRDIDVSSNPNLEWLAKAYRACSTSPLDRGVAETDGIVKFAHSILDLTQQPITASNIEQLSLIMQQYHVENEKGKFAYELADLGGVFLTACIARCIDDRIAIHTNHLEKSFDCLVASRNKYVTVKGDIGDWTGYHMTSGVIDVLGDAKDLYGVYMRGGELIVRGNAHHVGEGMHGGIIRVYGNVRGLIGDEMEGGTIHLNGDYGSLGTKMSGGDIYHKGKQIVKDGERLEEKK